jgi:hypothetical protein
MKEGKGKKQKKLTFLLAKKARDTRYMCIYDALYSTGRSLTAFFFLTAFHTSQSNPTQNTGNEKKEI